MVLASTTFIRDSTLFLRDFLLTNITDPISSSRSSDSRFVLTAYPKRAVQYPVVTVKLRGAKTLNVGGIQSEMLSPELIFEIRVWAKEHKQKDDLAEKVIDKLRDEQFTTSTGTIQYGLYDFTLRSLVPVDEDGEDAVKSNVIEISYRTVLT